MSDRLSDERIEDLRIWLTGGVNNPAVNTTTYTDLHQALIELERYRTTRRSWNQNAEEAWESQVEQIGEAAHAAWKRYMIGQGYADHALPVLPAFEDMVEAAPGALRLWQPCCDITPERHHPDMVPWADLPEHKRGKYLEPAKAVFLATYTKGYEIGVGDALSARQIKEDEAHLRIASTTRIHTKRSADLRRSQLAEEYPIVKDLLDEIEDLNPVVEAAREVNAVVPFLLSCIACGESLSAEEEAEIRAKRATLAAALAGQPTADPRDAVVEAAGALLAVCDGCETCYYAKEHTTLTAALAELEVELNG